jgi:hypothetical protein
MIKTEGKAGSSQCVKAEQAKLGWVLPEGSRKRSLQKQWTPNKKVHPLSGESRDFAIGAYLGQC